MVDRTGLSSFLDMILKSGSKYALMDMASLTGPGIRVLKRGCLTATLTLTHDSVNGRLTGRTMTTGKKAKFVSPLINRHCIR